MEVSIHGLQYSYNTGNKEVKDDGSSFHCAKLNSNRRIKCFKGRSLLGALSSSNITVTGGTSE